MKKFMHLRLITVCMLLSVVLHAAAKDFYAVLSNGTVTFYYDDNKVSRGGEDIYSTTPRFYAEATKAVMDASMADYAPSFMTTWFYGCSALTSIEGMEYLNTSEVLQMNGLFHGCSSLTSLDLTGFDTSNVTTMNGMFAGCSSLTELDLSSFNTSKVKDMGGIFAECSNLKTIYVDENKWSTAAVTSENGGNMALFYGCGPLVGGNGTKFSDTNKEDLDYACVDKAGQPGYLTHKAGPASGPASATAEPYAVLSDNNTVLTFYYDNQKAARNGMSVGPFKSEVDPSWYYNRESITSVVFDDSFAKCTTLTSTAYWFCIFRNLSSISGISNLKTDNVTDMSSMFSHCSSLTSLDVTGFNTGKVTSMRSMFINCSGLTSLDLSGFNTEHVELMSYMFQSCSGLTTIYIGDGWSTANVLYSCDLYMFTNCTSLVGGAGTVYDSKHADRTYARIDGGAENPGYFTAKNATPTPSADAEPYVVLSQDNQTVTFYYDDQKAAREGIDINNKYLNKDSSSPYGSATVAVFDASFANYQPVSTTYWFSKCSLLTSIKGIENLNTEKVTNMSAMFYECSGLTSLDVSGFQTDNVTDMSHMFYGCSGLTSLDVSGFKTDNVRDMGFMFYGCSGLTSLDVSGFKTDNVMRMSRMFSGCSSLTSLDVSGFQTDNVTDMNHMFYGCSGLTSLDVSGFKTDNVTNMLGMFYGCSGLTSLDVSGFKTDNVTDMSWMFDGCSSLTSLDVSGFKTDNVTDMRNMFSGCSSLTSLDVSGFKTDNVTKMYRMFYKCSGLTSLDVSGFKTDNVTVLSWMFDDCSSLTSLDVSGFQTDNVTDMYCMFQGCSGLTSLDVSGFQTDNVTDMNYMFYGCSSLTSLDVSGFKTDNVTNMTGMFYGCSSLTSLDVSGFKTDNVTSMNGMFCNCFGLTSLDVTGFKTDNVTNMSSMFSYCSGLTSLDVSGFQTDNVTDMGSMFSGCSSLTSLDVSGFKTDNVTKMGRMFYKCSGLTSLDVSGFKTDNVTDMSRMFYECSSLTSLDVSGFKTDNVTKMSWMFDGCSALKTIYSGNGWSTTAVTESVRMFNRCTSVVGGAGTVYNAEQIDHTYAHIDGGTENPGYFTSIEAKDEVVNFTNSKGWTFEGNLSTGEATLVSVNKDTEGETIVPETVINGGNAYTVTALRKDAFKDCSKIEKITIAKSIKDIECPAFTGCSSLKAFDVVQESAGKLSAVDGVLYSAVGTNDECLIAYPAAKASEFEIPASVKAIASGAFANAKLASLTVSFSEPLEIPADIFEGMDFDNCVLNVPLGSSSKYREHKVWGQFKNISGEKEVTVDDAVYQLDEDGTVTFVGVDKSKAVGDYVVPETIKVDNVEVAVKEIAPKAFENCTGLVSVTIPANIQIIGDAAFKGCTGLEEIYCLSAVPIDLSKVFASRTRVMLTRSGEVITQFEGIDFETCILYVPAGSKKLYEQAEGWKQFKNIVEMGETAAITISGAKQVTYMSDKDLDFTGYPDLKAYVATGYDKASGTIWLTRVKEIPANTGFLLMGEANTYEIPVKAGGLSAYYQNMFKGTIEGTTIQTTDGDNTNYYLSDGESGVGFYKVQSSVELKPNRAYLSVPTEIPAVGTAGSTETIKVSAAGQVPYCNSQSLDFSSLDAQGVKAYTATGYDYNSGTIWLTRVKQVPAKTGILIMAPEGEYPVPTASISSVYANMFRGTLEGTTIQTHEEIDGKDYINYYLSSGASGVGFYRVTKEEGVTIGANRCYLPILNKDAAAGTRSVNSDLNQIAFEEADEVIGIPLFRGIGGDENGTTSIKVLTPALSSEGEGTWYTLQGQRVAKPGKGLYIRNGHKVVIK